MLLFVSDGISYVDAQVCCSVISHACVVGPQIFPRLRSKVNKYNFSNRAHGY